MFVRVNLFCPPPVTNYYGETPGSGMVKIAQIQRASMNVLGLLKDNGSRGVKCRLSRAFSIATTMEASSNVSNFDQLPSLKGVELLGNSNSSIADFQGCCEGNVVTFLQIARRRYFL